MPKKNRLVGWWPIQEVVVLALILIVSISGAAQLPTGTILGVVKDTNGGIVPGTAVTVRNTDTGLTRTVMTGEDGAYRFPALPVGHYEVQVMKEGFQTANRKGLTLEVAQTATVDFTLEVGSTQQTVTVISEAPQIDITSSSSGGTISEQQVADLPLNGRNFVDLTIMQPGVTQTSITTGPYGMNGTMYSTNGATLRSNNTMLDGAPMTTLMGVSAGSIIGTSLGVDGIKEYKVVTVLPNASYGLNMGGQTTIVSKGGTNQWHGDVFEYLRNAALDARNYFDALDITNHNGFGTNKSLTFPGKRLPPFNRNNFGGAIGGPIRKDKTFVFGVYEGLRERFSPTTTATTFNKGCFYGRNTPGGPDLLNNNIPLYINNSDSNPYGLCVPRANVGSPAIPNTLITVGCPNNNIIATTGCSITPTPLILQLASVFPQPNVTGLSTFNYTFPFKQPANENYSQIRFDQIFSDKDSAFVRYTIDTVEQFTPGNYPAFLNRNRSAAYIGTISETHILSPTLLNTVHFSFSRTGLNLAIPTVPRLTSGVLVPGKDASTGISPGSGITAMGTSGNTTGDIFQNVFSISDDIFWTKGKHALQFGTAINHYTGLYRVDIFDRGSVSFSSITDFFKGNWSTVSGRAANGNQHRLWNWNTLGFYLQDDYHVVSRLTLNLGLRYEFMTTLKAPPGLGYTVENIRTSPAGTPGTLYLNNSLHDFSPRLGFAWDVTGRGTTALRGGAGVYYDIADPGSEIAGNGSGDPTLSKLINLTTTGTTPTVTINGVAAPAPLTAAPDCFTPMCPAFQAAVQRTVRVADYRMAQPSMGQWNLSLDRQLPLGMALSVAYIGTKGWHIKQTTEGNPTLPLGYEARGLPYYCQIVNTAIGACANSNFRPRTNPVFDRAQYYTAGGDSYYHGLQTSLNMRLHRGLQSQLNYTYAKGLDDGQKVNSDAGSTAVSGQTVDQLFTDKGPSFVDIRHNVRGNLIYHAPEPKWDNFAAKILRGWWFSSIVSFQTGLPINPILGVDRALQNNGNISTRPNLDASFDPHKVITSDINRWFDPTMFALQPAGTLGNAGRNILRGPKLTNVDFSIDKDTNAPFFGEQGKVQFRAEIFNVFNHPNFLAPSGAIWSSPGNANIGTVASGRFGSPEGPAILKTAGQITGTSTKSRQIQFAIKVLF